MTKHFAKYARIPSFLSSRQLGYIDPRGLPTVTASSDHYFHSWCLSVCPSVLTFENLAKPNKFQVRIVIITGDTVGLAEWIIDSMAHMSCIIIRLVKRQKLIS